MNRYHAYPHHFNAQKHKIEMFKDGKWAKLLKWCEDNVHHLEWEPPQWYAQYPYVCFRDKHDYLMFLLKWS